MERSVALAYSNMVLANAIDWYKNADTKAQIILTMDGALVAFLTSSLFKKAEDISAITARFTPLTWTLLAAMCTCLAGSIICALTCLWSRVFLGTKRDSVLRKEREQIGDEEKAYSPNVMFFFKTICWLDHDRFQEQLEHVDEEFHIRAVGSQAYLLSKRVLRKHALVNAGFVLAGASLILFLTGGVSYLAHVS
ncbi:Pycsar system effector family protein [Occallatibacter riparius]|uniref:DUF5706 domain-containing protein n=1 Tax=Occallatibacter riparius TaxID=1002689 RepID=A0A9J7BS65_9BACT|nr:Pycsar system effector family protein [Occallatibacter riparius]UWZ85724.1 DUF5706 domain-containing protein [Occallatibacter riparius]